MIKAETRTSIEDSTVTREAECPECGEWRPISTKQASGETYLICNNCGWRGYTVGRMVSS